MDDFEYDEEECEHEIPARRFLKADLLVLGLDLISGITSAVNNTANKAFDIAAMHANFTMRQHDFAEEAALEIETLTQGD